MPRSRLKEAAEKGKGLAKPTQSKISSIEAHESRVSHQLPRATMKKTMIVTVKILLATGVKTRSKAVEGELRRSLLLLP